MSASNVSLTEYEYFIYNGKDDTEACHFIGNTESLNYNITTGYSFSISLSNGKLKNQATNYYIKLRVKTTGDILFGDWSSAVSFYCKEKPTLGFVGMTANETTPITMYAAVFELQYTYNLEQAETLKNYKYYFYDSEKKLLESSVEYPGAITNTLSQYGLKNDSTYYVRGTGTTKNGYELDSGYYEIHVKFSDISNSYALEAVNNAEKGCIEISSHFISIEGIPSGDYSFETDESGMTSIDLSSGANVMYSLSSDKRPYDFVLKYVVKPVLHKTLSKIIFEDDVYGELTTNVRDYGDGEKLHATFSLHIGENFNYIIRSNCIDVGNFEYLYICLFRKDGYFNLTIKAMDTAAREAVR
nr:MAG TPA: hypothetical protein [Caudoviricetes sp.]